MLPNFQRRKFFLPNLGENFLQEIVLLFTTQHKFASSHMLSEWGFKYKILFQKNKVELAKLDI